MKKIPLELFGPKSDTKPRSPLIWNGLQFDLCEELTLTEISSLLAECKQVNFDIVNMNFDFQSKFYTAQSLLSDLKSWYKSTESVFNELNDISGKFLLRLSQLEDEVGIIEGLSTKLDIKLFDIKGVMSKVTDGTLVHGSAKYRVTYTSGKYVIKRENLAGPFFTSNDVITITDRAEGKVVDYNPYKDVRYLAGSGIYLNELENYKTVNIANIVRSSGSIEVNQLLNKFLVKPKNLLLTSKNVDVQVTILPETGFKVSVKPSATYALDFAFSAGYGVTIDEYTVSVSNNFYPKIVAGKGIYVTKDALNNYQAHFKYVDSGLPPIIGINALYPLYATYTSIPPAAGSGKLFPTDVYNIGLNYTYQQGMQNILDNIVKSLENTQHEINHITMDNLSEGAKRKLACPILNLFDFAAYGKLNQDTGTSSDPISTKLSAKFGTRPVNVDLSMEILPLAILTGFGAGSALGVSFSFNVFLFLESWLQQQLGDASFTISPNDINTRYYVSLLDIDSTSITVKDVNAGELDGPAYNTAWVVNPAAISKTYPGMGLCCTTGDVDFFRGVVRNGQTNSVPLTVPTNFYSLVEAGQFKINVTSASKVANNANNTITYTMTVVDSIFNQTYNLQWSRPIYVMDSNHDYMTELSTVNVPGHVRMIARLYANWQYNNEDLNRLLYEISKYSEFITTSGVDTIGTRIGNKEYIAAESYATNATYKLTVLKFDRITGECKVEVDMSNMSVGYAYYAVETFLKAISVPIKFVVLPVTSSGGTNDDIIAACCWDDLEYASTLDCTEEVVTTTPPPGETTTPPPGELADCAKILFNNQFNPTSTPTTTPPPTTTTTTTTTPRPPTTTVPITTTTTTTKAPTTTTTTTKAPTTTTTTTTTTAKPQPVCNQNPTGIVKEMEVPQGFNLWGHGTAAPDLFYMLYVQSDIQLAKANTKYLMMATLSAPYTGVYTFKLFSDDEFELYIDCVQVKTGTFGYHQFALNINQGPRQFILRYKNVPDNTPGYAGFNIYNNVGTVIYRTRAVDWKGQANSIGTVEWV